ncbi:MAG TPA: hypothetical protein VGN82_21170 [Bosea sp. (in: a-proteobacteria)]|uniref:hypothetical protein n=1 Tax=Bosea sp. (in: a-proteobacteria) TaxID=1871050 RepID=UPI002E0E830E|nr:hypothetical protein [Bosea sp. (in: a-proteobacteria)]
MEPQLKGDFDIRNLVLLSLRPEARAYLQPRLITRRLSLGQVLYEDNAPFTHAIFPHDGVVSMHADMQDARGVEKAAIGYEGFVGIALVMGGTRRSASPASSSRAMPPGFRSKISTKPLRASPACATPCCATPNA